MIFKKSEYFLRIFAVEFGSLFISDADPGVLKFFKGIDESLRVCLKCAEQLALCVLWTPPVV